MNSNDYPILELTAMARIIRNATPPNTTEHRLAERALRYFKLEDRQNAHTLLIKAVRQLCISHKLMTSILNTIVTNTPTPIDENDNPLTLDDVLA
jgi:hypothetical protein